MSFDVSALSAYTKENEAKLAAKTILSPKTAALIEQSGNVLVEIKSAEKIGSLETDAVFQAGSCGFNSSGSTAFSQRTLTVGDIKVEEQLCYKDLEAKYTQKMLTAGATYENPEDFDFYSWWIDRKIKHAANALETAIWQGDTASGNGQLNKFDGFIKLITGATDEVDANDTDYLAAVITVAGGGFTTSNAIEAMQAVVQAAPQAVRESEDFRVFVSPTHLLYASLQLYGANKFHHKDGELTEMVIPGTNSKAVAVPGLAITSGIFGMRLSNMYIGTDLVSDTTEVQAWYEKKDNAICYRNAFKFGVQVAFTNECVKLIPA